MVRTSESHPISISEVACGPGLIGMTFCPGKKGPSVYGAPWDRDLRADLAALAEWRPDYVVTLMEAHEFRLLGIPELGKAIEAAGLRWMHLPIVDVGVPDDAFHLRWMKDDGEALRRCLRNGGRVLLHCRGGLGRTGLVAARLLLEEAFDEPEVAVEKVRAARPGAIETEEQERYVHLSWVGLIAAGIRDE